LGPNRRIMVLKATRQGELADAPPPSPRQRAAELQAPMVEGPGASSTGPVLKLR